MGRTDKLINFIEDIVTAVQTKDGGGSMKPSQISTRILAIPQGGSGSDRPIAIGNILPQVNGTPSTAAVRATLTIPTNGVLNFINTDTVNAAPILGWLIGNRVITHKAGMSFVTRIVGQAGAMNVEYIDARSFRLTNIGSASILAVAGDATTTGLITEARPIYEQNTFALAGWTFSATGCTYASSSQVLRNTNALNTNGSFEYEVDADFVLNTQTTFSLNKLTLVPSSATAGTLTWGSWATLTLTPQ